MKKKYRSVGGSVMDVIIYLTMVIVLLT